jgi:hypothetical protein
MSTALVVGLGCEFGPELELKRRDAGANADATGPRIGMQCQVLEAQTGY